MLEEFRITGLGVIDDAVLELSPGFTVVTGETGAGKTMVVTGLGLLFGGRADPSRVRPGATRAGVEGRLLIPAEGRVAKEILESGGELDEPDAAGRAGLIVSRTVSAEGRSRAYAGGRSVPVSLLTYLADDLVAVHGQADQQQLLRAGRQRAALDRYAGEPLQRPLAEYQRAHARHREVAAELAELTTRSRERLQEADLLRFGLDEIERADPKPGEDADLLAEEERLAYADALRGAATGAHQALLGDPAAEVTADAVSLIGTARHGLEAVRHHDAELAALADRLAEASYLVSDVAGELASYAESVEADPLRLAAVQERRAALTQLIRKYGTDGGGAASVLEWGERAAARLATLTGDDERIEALRDERDALVGRLGELAAELTAIRTDAAARFGAEVTAELAALAMPHARIVVAVTQPEEDPAAGTGEEPGDGGRSRFGPHGVDDIEIRLVAHPGAPALPLHKGASGGELSRVMLAIEVVFAGADPVPTFVFDEVDAGVGGKAAVEVGRRLAALARAAQVIVVTHLPQVAAFADNHLTVVKSGDGRVTRSGVVRLDADGRVRELSRMLAGLEDSELGRAHAEELLEISASERAAAGGGARGPTRRRGGR